MLAKCANPTCTARFRYLHEGKIFNIDMAAPSGNQQRHIPRIEYFWLCEECVETHKLVLEHGVVTARLRRLELPPAPEKPEKKREVA